MMERLMTRADGFAHAAQRRRIERIAAAMRAQRIPVETTADSVIVRGRSILHKWLGEPLLRFAGRCGR